MSRDADIAPLAERSCRNLMLELNDLGNRLSELDDVEAVHNKPTSHRIYREVAVLMLHLEPEVCPATVTLRVPAALSVQPG